MRGALTEFVSPDDTEAMTVFPDIIVHRRRTDENLIVLEVKKTGGDKNIRDIKKLRAFTRDSQYRCHMGLSLRIGAISDLELWVFREGKKNMSWTKDLKRALGELGHDG